ncbi:MAG TPA: error-prone DNA polymerase [Microbacteriaceae bacterium]|nr:error-prone DNA polymerase [Microbacteriaceae bacterium]
MGWNNPPIPWAQLERTLSGRGRRVDGEKSSPTRGAEPSGGDDGGGRAGSPSSPRAPVPYAELHAHSNYSFLDGASSPEELLRGAARLGLTALALTDHDGLYGVVRMAEAANALRRRHPDGPTPRTVFGAELSLGMSGRQGGVADPEGDHLLVLARGRAGYRRLAHALTEGHLNGDAAKGSPRYDLERLAGTARGDWVILTGCRKGSVRRVLEEATRRGDDLTEIRRAVGAGLDRLTQLFGQENVFVELIDHGHPGDEARNDILAAVAHDQGLPLLASNNVHYATPVEHRLAQTVAAVRSRRSLDELDGWLPAAGTAHLRSGAEQAARFARYPGAVENTVAVAEATAFELRSLNPRLPAVGVPAGHTPMSWLRELVRCGVAERYPAAPREEAAVGDSVWARLHRELDVIEAKDFPGYFLIMHDIVRFARDKGILCQGRGSAANSAVCYALGITAVDSIFYGLPFERFLSSIRDDEPDIDIDFDSGRREEVIQYVYGRYGRRSAAQVADVISYRPRSAVRDVAKALGYGPGLQDAWSAGVGRSRTERDGDAPTRAPGIPPLVEDLSGRLLKAPRHLGIHSGGMVLTRRPVGDICPIERAAMPGRTVLQWDKEDCAWMGLVKFDLLGLGMLAALRHVLDLVTDPLGESWSLASIPREEPAVYDMLCRADTIGVFQVESRAQMGMLPRLRPRSFYDLAIQIALIRPGPIQGGAVHPYIRRRTGGEAVTYLHPALEPVLRRTLGVPLFQEQLMQMAMAVGGCDAEDADLLRRAMGSKRGVEHVETLREKLYEGMAAHGISEDDADAIYAKIEAFASFGFAESHSLAFAHLVYASSWLKLHYPAAFLAALLRAQPMGFYAPHTLVDDARRHGVRVLPVDVLHSDVDAGLEPIRSGGRAKTPRAGGMPGCLDHDQPPVGPFEPGEHPADATHRRDGAYAVRLGLTAVREVGRPHAERIVEERRRGPYRDMNDLSRRAGLTAAQLESLAAAGALAGFGLSRRAALWSAGPAAQESLDRLAGSAVTVQPPLLPLLTDEERTAFDLWATGVSGQHPLQHLRASLTARGVVSTAEARVVPSGYRVEVAGAVTHRQRPRTAGGITFLNLEDETGILNVVVRPGVWKRFQEAAASPAMLVRGVMERSVEGVSAMLADRIQDLRLSAPLVSRDFR